jgi:hypothetical protein
MSLRACIRTRLLDGKQTEVCQRNKFGEHRLRNSQLRFV